MHHAWMNLIAAIMEINFRLLTAQLKLLNLPWRDGVAQGESDRLQMPLPLALARCFLSSALRSSKAPPALAVIAAARPPRLQTARCHLRAACTTTLAFCASSQQA